MVVGRWIVVGWALVACVACGGGTVAEDDEVGSGTGVEWPVECLPFTEDLATDVQGTLGPGTLTVWQTFAGETKSVDVDVFTIAFENWSAPAYHLAALGFFGDWHTYVACGCSDTNMDGLWAAGGGGEVFARDTNTADGGANTVAVSDAEVCATQSGFHYRYDARYEFSDVVDGSITYFDEAPTVLMEAEEHYEVTGDGIAVEARAVGSDGQGGFVELRVSGTLGS